MRASPTTPPTTPPAIAPVFILEAEVLELDGVPKEDVLDDAPDVLDG